MTRLGVVVALLLFAGCGDPLLCKSDVFVALQTTTIAADLDPAPGVQGDLRLKTSLDEGESVDLTILDVDGHVTSTTSALVDALGEATVRVTLPAPKATVRATAVGRCGEGTDEETVDVVAGTGCELAFDPAPAPNDHYAPLGVFDGAADTNTVLPGLQTQVKIATRADWLVDVYVASSAGESLVVSGPATDGIAALVATLPDGNVAVRAVCHDAAGSQQIPSLSTAVIVDTGAPTCDITSPVPGSTITPALDLDHDLSNGVQLDVGIGEIGNNDIIGEPFDLTVTEQGGSPIDVTGALDSSGAGNAAVTLAPAATPATYTFALAGRDHAGNTCHASHVYTVVLDGCDIAITAPTAPVTADADGNAANGAQVDLSITVAPACAGRTVTTTCGIDAPTGVVPAAGPLVVRETVCATSPCETAASCTATVSTATGVVTTATLPVQFDNAAPVVTVAVVTPALPCGAQVSPADDADPALPGVQVFGRVTATGTVASQSIALATSGGTTSFDASSDVELTLAPGQNRLTGSATDPLGNVGTSTVCSLTLADLSVSFSAPAADGTVGGGDGTVSGNALTFPLCGTVNKTGATVTVAIDGGAAQPATVTGTGWCRTITLAASPPDHTIVVNATAGTSFGTSSLVLTVDLTPPSPIANLAVTSPDRETFQAGWTAPSDGGLAVDHYIFKQSTTVLTDANFDATGAAIATGTPAAPGSAEMTTIGPSRTGQLRWFGLAAVDPQGNRTSAAIVGPLAPAFDRSGAIVAPDPSLGNLALGSAIAHGKFNDDEFDDLAVSAPTQSNMGAVYVYFGTASGISATPDLVILGSVAAGHVGSSLGAVRWSSATRDDLVVGASGLDSSAGRVFVFANATLGTGTRQVATAEHQVSVSPTSNAFTASQLGASLVVADLDGDGIDDLAIAAPNHQAGLVACIYGPITANLVISNTSASGLGGATLEIITDPKNASGRRFGNYLHLVDGNLLIAYSDDATTAGDSLYVYRRTGTRPPSGISQRAFAIGRDVRIDLVTASKLSEWGSQATTIEDQDGDGVRELVIGAYQNAGTGQVLIVDGAVLGTAGVATTTDPGVVLATISGSANGRLGIAIAEHDPRAFPDVDGDGKDDLLIAGLVAGSPKLFVWFGGSIPSGAVNASTAPYQITGPSTFKLNGARARWIGDVDGDGLPDVCWSSPIDNSGDGSFEVLR